MGLPYFPMFPTDFEADTSHLTLAEDGAYNRLLRLVWMSPGCSLPDDDAWILRRMRCHSDEDCAVVIGIIDEFFARSKGRVSNARLTREYDKSKEAHEKRVSAGSRGGKAKSLKTLAAAPSNAKAKLKQPEPEPEPVKRDTKVSPKTPPLFSLFPGTVSVEVAKAYVDHRKAIKKPLTARAITLLSKTLAECEANGITANTALDTAIESGWQGLKLSWVQNALSQNSPTNGARNERPNSYGTGNGSRGSQPAPSLASIIAGNRAQEADEERLQKDGDWGRSDLDLGGRAVDGVFGGCEPGDESRSGASGDYQGSEIVPFRPFASAG